MIRLTVEKYYDLDVDRRAEVLAWAVQALGGRLGRDVVTAKWSPETGAIFEVLTERKAPNGRPFAFYRSWRRRPACPSPPHAELWEVLP